MTSDLMHIGVKKKSSGGSSFLLIFLKNKCNFLHKDELDCRQQIMTSLTSIITCSQWNKETDCSCSSHKEFFSWNSCHHCHTEASAYAKMHLSTWGDNYKLLYMYMKLADMNTTTVHRISRSALFLYTVGCDSESKL